MNKRFDLDVMKFSKLLLILLFPILSFSMNPVIIGLEENELSSPVEYRVVSDFDDTLKRSNIPNMGWEMVGRVPLIYSAYIGMAELYNAFYANHGELYILSASPNLIGFLLRSTLALYGIQYTKLFTRSLNEFGADKKIKYKISRIEQTLKGNNEKLILLGDDVEADYTIYKEIEKRNPGRVASIYIRRVLNIDLPSGVTGFYSAFEIAASEYSLGRASFEQVKSVAQAILDIDDDDMNEVIPEYAYCPKEMKEFTPVLDSKLYELEFLVQIKITDYCLSR